MRFFILLLILFAFPVTAMAQMTIDTLAKQAMIIDYDTGAILLNKNADERMPTSSMSKVLTDYVVFDAIKKGKITLEDKFPVSQKAWSTQGSKTFVELGNLVSVNDLIHGVSIQSGNDATIVLAEGLAGTEEAFADQLNATAKKLGMANSHFMNASGLPDPDHYSTARDLAVLGRSVIRDFPDYYPLYSQKDFTYHGIKQGNRNPLLYNGGGDGIKTGHTDAGGFGLIGSGVSGGRRVIVVINGLGSMPERATESAKLLQWGLNSFRNVELFKAGQKIADADVVKGQRVSIPLIVSRNMVFTVPRSAADQFKISAHYKSPLIAPVKKGDHVGTLVIEAPNMKNIEVPLEAGASVDALGFFAMMPAKLNLMMHGGG